MPVQSHQVVYGSQSGSRQNVTYIFTMHTAETTSVSKLLPIGTDFDADAQSMYSQIVYQFEEQEYQQAINEIDNRRNPDKVPTDHLAQVDFDRRVMGYMMTVEDPHKLNVCLPFWQAVQPRNGNNRLERIANLGVPDTEYDELADRMDLYFGVASFLSDDLAAIWPDVKEAWE